MQSDISLLPPPAESTSSFLRFGPDVPVTPLVISIPHAARDYAPALMENARVDTSVLARLEDRYADHLGHGLIAQGHAMLVARMPRAMLDLNRDEREVDPAMVRNVPHGTILMASAKMRGGLGLIPRRLAMAGELWRGPMAWHDVEQRIALCHRPYHAALSGLLRRARDMHGHAILIDLHSMPPLADSGGMAGPVRIVLGDRFGRSASARITGVAGDVFARHGLTVAHNHPYPGNYLLDRHGRPERGIHALQCEIDRSLYLDAALDQPGQGLAKMQQIVAELADVLAHELPRTDYALAAE